MNKTEIKKLAKAGEPHTFTIEGKGKVTATPVILEDGTVKLVTGKRGRPVIVEAAALA